MINHYLLWLIGQDKADKKRVFTLAKGSNILDPNPVLIGPEGQRIALTKTTAEADIKAHRIEWIKL